MSLKLFERYGDPNDTAFIKAYMVMYDTPKHLEVGVIPKRVYCNKDFAPVLETFFKNLIDRNLWHEILTWDGCYNLRPIRGYEKHFEKLYNGGNVPDSMKYLSAHSWGTAFDINAAWNRLGQTPTMSDKLIQCIKDSGLIWGGDFKRRDGMHCELKI